MSNMVFTVGTVRGLRNHQKIKLFARRQLIHLPAHKRMDKFEKMKKQFYFKKANSDEDKSR